MRTTITLEYLNKLFYIDEANVLRWKIQKGRRNPHEVAGRISTHGYYEVRIDGDMRPVHRLMYQMYNELDTVDSALLVDHVDMNPLNNTRANLRICTKSENQQNRGKQNNNKSGFKGVSFDKDRNKWQVGIGFKGKRYALGRYDSPELAYEAYCIKAKELHGDFHNLG